MKRLVIAIIMILISTVSMAADVMIIGKASTVTQKISKNGDPYVIVAVPEEKSLNGVKYTSETSVFCFKSPEAAKIKQGDSVKFIAKKTVDKTGNEFTTLISILK